MPSVICPDVTVLGLGGGGGGGGGGPVYSTSPYGVAGAIAWYKADAETFQDSALSTPATADTNPVGGWKDQTGLGHHQLQTTGTKRPLLKLAQQNGLPCLRFDGVDDALQALFTLSGSVHFFLVVRPISATNGHRFLSAGSGTNFDFYQDTVAPNVVVYNGSVTSVPNAGMAVGTWGLFQVLGDGANGHIKTNANAKTFVNVFTSTAGVSVASSSGGVANNQIDVGELIVYNVALSDTDETTVRNGLNARWALF